MGTADGEGGGGMSGWMQDIGDVQEQDNTQFSSHYVLPFSFQRAFAVCCCYGIHTVTQPHSHTATHTHTRPHTHTHTYIILLPIAFAHLKLLFNRDSFNNNRSVFGFEFQMVDW